MLYMKNLPELDLTVFGDGGGDGDGGGEQGAEDGILSAADSMPQTGSNGAGVRRPARGRSAAGENQGAEAPDEGFERGDPAHDEEPGGEDARKLSFEELLRDPDYKSAYDAKVRAAIQNRFKRREEGAALLERMGPLMEAIGRKYGLDMSTAGERDLESVIKAVNDESGRDEAEAKRRGLSLRAYRELQSLESRNLETRARAEKLKADEERRENVGRILRQAEAVKSLYPGFDLKKEIQNPAFGRLILNGVDAQTAYEVVHKNEIIPAVMEYTARTTAAKIAGSIRSGGHRPEENGASGAASATHAQDPSKLSPQQRREIRRRVANGEKIYW